MYHKNYVKLFTLSNMISLGKGNVIDDAFSDGI